MRTLVLMRGLPGCGKTTWIKKNNLEQYALSADQFRLLLQSPRLQADGTTADELSEDGLAWNHLFSVLEHRMSQGEFTVIDATHTTDKSLSYYKGLATKYRYRVYIVDLSSIHLDVVISRNKERESHRRVPTKRLIQMNENMQKQVIPKWITVVEPNCAYEFTNMLCQDLNEYDKIHHIGDIHGCNTVLQEYLNGGLNPNHYYIFLGDYVDRGIEHNDLLNFLLQIYKLPNVCLLEGNHDKNIFYYGNQEHDLCTEEFAKNTRSQLQGIKGAHLRDFYRHLRQCIAYQYGTKRVICTHGGISRYDVQLPLIATSSLIRGSGAYDDANLCDLTFTKSVKDDYQEIYQIHGHRNPFNSPIQVTDNCFNLEGAVEHGGDLRVVTLDNNGFETFQIRNNVFKVTDFESNIKIQNVPHLVELMRNSPYISEHKANNISSFNFTQKAFYGGVWNNLNNHARGLFINTERMEIVARSYDKFFNLNEREETKLENLKSTLKFPVSGYLKENGFLGILGYDDESNCLLFCSKSRIYGEYSSMFKNIMKELHTGTLTQIKEYLKDRKCSMVFEVIDVVNDPHIIEYKTSKVVLLGVIENTMEFNQLPYEQLVDVARQFNLPVKQLEFVANNFDELIEILEENKNRHIEGFVIEDADNFMFKVKLPYYNYWKYMRNIMEDYRVRGTTIREYKEKDYPVIEWLCNNVKYLDNFLTPTKRLDTTAVRKHMLSQIKFDTIQ